MFQRLEVTRMAQALAAHAGARLQTIAGNVANADTPGYHAMDVADFAESVAESGSLTLRATRPGHSLSTASQTLRLIRAGDAQSPNGNDVSLDMQMAKAVSARQSHDMALAVYQSAATILRLSLGRT